MPQSQAPDLLILFTTLLALALPPSLSAVLAPYVVVFVGAMLGTGWGLKRRAPGSGSAWAFSALMLGTSLVFTMPAAVWLQRYLGAGSLQWLLAPLAALIAAVGDDWPRVGAWAAELGRRVITRKADAE